MKINNLIVSLMLLLVMFSLNVMASPDKKKKVNDKDAGTTITLVTSGTGDTKEEATKNALRSALEQTYGTFVSSNTQVVNDELVRDEIVSISSGNIVSYEELSFIDSNPKQVTVKAVVSITKLQNYAQNKGMAAELAGATFAMNMKIDELNQQNEKKALEHLAEQIQMNSSQIFDYRLVVGSPQKYEPKGPAEAALMRSNGAIANIVVPLTLRIIASKNTVAFYDMVHNTLSSFAISKKEGSLPGWHEGIVFPVLGENRVGYVLRSGNQTNADIGVSILRAIEKAAFSCEIIDNAGNTSSFMMKTDYDRDYKDKCCYITCLGVGYVIPTNKLVATQNGHENPYSYRIFLNHKETYIDSWLGANKPSVGDVLFEIKLHMNYTQDEISKISKIEVRPKQPQQVANNEVMAIYNDVKEFMNCIDIYNDETKNDELRINSIKKAYNILKRLKEDPLSKEVIPPGVIDEYLEQIESVLHNE